MEVNKTITISTNDNSETETQAIKLANKFYIENIDNNYNINTNNIPITLQSLIDTFEDIIENLKKNNVKKPTEVNIKTKQGLAWYKYTNNLNNTQPQARMTPKTAN